MKNLPQFNKAAKPASARFQVVHPAISLAVERLNRPPVRVLSPRRQAHRASCQWLAAAIRAFHRSTARSRMDSEQLIRPHAHRCSRCAEMIRSKPPGLPRVTPARPLMDSAVCGRLPRRCRKRAIRMSAARIFATERYQARLHRPRGRVARVAPVRRMLRMSLTTVVASISRTALVHGVEPGQILVVVGGVNRHQIRLVFTR